MLTAFPKIFAIGTDYVQDLFKEDVEITEKVDGSQFVFGRVDGEIVMRSKGKQIYLETHDKLFSNAVEYVQSIQDKIPDEDIAFYCEYLQRPRHNMLAYERIPKNNLILFGVSNCKGSFVSKHSELQKYADVLDIEVIPLLYQGHVYKFEEFKEVLDQESVLGGAKVEGVVVKNYERQFLLGGQPMPLMAGKYVSESFKEVSREKWGKEKTTRGRYQTFKDSFKTDARWHKAIQHLKEKGELENSPRDIGKLIKEIQLDIVTEEQDEIKTFLWNEFHKEILGAATRGFPEFYKELLAKNSLSE